MEAYKGDIVSHDEMLQRKDYLFSINIDENTYQLFEKVGNIADKQKMLSAKMGDVSDEFLNDYLCKMQEWFKKINKENRPDIEEVLKLMFIFLKMNYGDLKKGGLSCCSHVQGFFSFYNPREAVSELFEKEYIKNREKLQSIYMEVATHDKIAEDYYTLAEDIKGKVKKALDAGEIEFVNYYQGECMLEGSEFHTSLYQQKGFWEMFESNSFKVQRFMTILHYYFLLTVGIKYQQRCLLCYMIYRTIEEQMKFTYTNFIQVEGRKNG